MKKNIVLIIFGMLFLFPVFACAHVTETDRSISAILHIEPADSPGAQEQSLLHFTFEDATHNLDLTKCACTISIIHGSSTLFTSTSLTIDKQTISVPFVFPEKEVYQITFAGKPITAGLFQPFSLHYTVRVDRGQTEQIPWYNQLGLEHLVHHANHIIIIGGGLVVGILLTLRKPKKIL